MRDYFLFLDIETSGLPRKWDLPGSDTDNWPCAVQVSWTVCHRSGQKIKTEDHYVNNGAVSLCAKAKQVHGLTQDFLRRHGKPREAVLTAFRNDLEAYRPLIVGHFLELDFRVLTADFCRIGRKNPMDDCPLCCTMLATQHLVRNPAKKYLRLEELHHLLFDASFANPHNAAMDVQATAACFFALVEKGEINPEADFRNEILRHRKTSGRPGCGLLFFLFIFTAFIFCFCP